jgi:hypothetical protein
MTHKTTVTLPDDLYAQWKATRQPLTEIIRHGLDGTGDTARHTATETRLAGIEHRVAQLEAAGRHFDGLGDEDGTVITVDDLPTLEEIEQRREQRDQLKAQEWHRTLIRHVKPDKAGQRVVTGQDAGTAFRLGSSMGRERMHMLVSFGLATLLDDGEIPYRWLIHEEDNGDGDDSE